MLKKSIDKLVFIMENFQLSTNAVSVSIIEKNGKIAVECGHIDLDIISRYVADFCKISQETLENISGYSNNGFFTFIEGVKNNLYIASLPSGLFLFALFLKNVNIFDIKDDIKRYTMELGKVLIDIKPYLEAR